MNGKIPKNVYGNLDVYVPSMVPLGGAHIPHQETARAARILGIDYADAVTGFVFKGRHGTAITNGAVVAIEYRDAMEEVVKAFDDERAQAEEQRRSLAALKTWKRFLAGLRIRERIEAYDIEGERDIAMKNEMEKVDEEDEDKGGGFLPDQSANEIPQPTAKMEATRILSSLEDDDGGGWFCGSEYETRGMEAPHTSPLTLNRVHDDDDDDDDEDDGDRFRFDIDEQRARREVGDEDLLEIGQEENNSPVHISEEHKDQRILDEGGGFLPDDDGIRDDLLGTDDQMKPYNPIMCIADNLGSIDPHGTSQNCEQFEEALPNLPAGELEEARLLQQLYESQGIEPLESKEETTMHASSNSPGSPPERGKITKSERGVSARRVEKFPGNKPVTVEDSANDSSEEDKGSLLSHDPDDEDADPEWLA